MDLENSIFPLLFLYAETHFRFFPGFPSLLFRREPEILFDLPARLAPGHDCPVILYLNDINRFPAQVHDITLTISRKGRKPAVQCIADPGQYIISHPLDFQCTIYRLSIPRSLLPDNRSFINAKASLTINGKKRICLNDNYFGSSKLPLQCFAVEEPLPGSQWCAYGDMHVHSQFSQSHVEFGPPLSIIDLVSDCYGLDFMCITDHSYDLACTMTDYLVQDPALRRWKVLSGECRSGNRFRTKILLGEEVSCLNSKGRVVHLCGCGLKDYIPGSRDGARRNTIYKKQLNINEAIDEIHDQNGIAYAAHPGARSGFLQRLFLGRGIWSPADSDADLDGMQAANGMFDSMWLRGKKLWIKQLLSGRQMPLLAGNDSHGDFNRYRCMNVPFFSFQEIMHRHLSSCRTGIYRKKPSDLNVADAIRNGETFVTNGPFITICRSENYNDSLVSHARIGPETGIVFIHSCSTHEFGRISRLRLFQGITGWKKEKMLFSRQFAEPLYHVTQKYDISDSTGIGYLRAEVECIDAAGALTQAYTSPCYFRR